LCDPKYDSRFSSVKLSPNVTKVLNLPSRKPLASPPAIAKFAVRNRVGHEDTMLIDLAIGTCTYAGRLSYSGTCSPGIYTSASAETGGITSKH